MQKRLPDLSLLIAIGIVLLLAPSAARAQNLVRIVEGGKAVRGALSSAGSLEGALQAYQQGSDVSAFVRAVRAGRGDEIIVLEPSLEPLVREVAALRSEAVNAFYADSPASRLSASCTTVGCSTAELLSESLANASLIGQPQRPRVVIAGAGIGGIQLAHRLSKQNVDVVLINKDRRTFFPPFLFEVAAGRLHHNEISHPVADLVRGYSNVRFTPGEVVDVDPDGGKVFLADGNSIDFDHLVVSVGTRANYFGKPEWQQHALSLKTLEDAEAVRNRALRSLYEAERKMARLAGRSGPDKERAMQDIRDQHLTFTFIGGGPMGVELAGGMQELLEPAWAELEHCKKTDVRIVLIHSRDRLIENLTERGSAIALADLESQGVEVLLNSRVTDITAEGVYVDEDFYPGLAHWSAGTQGHPVAATLGVETDRAGRVPVNRDLTIEGRDNIYVIGDVAAIPTGAEDGDVFPGVAQVALQSANLAAKNIAHTISGEAREPFSYKDKGFMAHVRHGQVVMSTPGFPLYGGSMSGKIPWLGWVALHTHFVNGGSKGRILYGNLRTHPRFWQPTPGFGEPAGVPVEEPK